MKNQGPLANNTGEAQGMVPHANGRSIWLLVYNTAGDRRRLPGRTGRPGWSPQRSPRRRAWAASLYKPSIVHSPDYNTLALGNGY